MNPDGVYIHPTAFVAPGASLGLGTRIWMNVQVRENARVGRDCIIGKDAYIDFEVILGDCCKIQNGAFVYHAAELEEGVFIGPGAILTNDRVPRALTVEGKLVGTDDWHSGRIHIGRGASVGAGAIVLTDLSIGEHAMIGAGAVVTHHVPAHTLVVGNPARAVGFVCRCGRRLQPEGNIWKCRRDALVYETLSQGGLVAIESLERPEDNLINTMV